MFLLVCFAQFGGVARFLGAIVRMYVQLHTVLQYAGTRRGDGAMLRR